MMMYGFILYQNRIKKITLNYYLNSALWMMSLAVLLGIILLAHVMFMPADVNKTSLFENALYLALYRNFWALATAWMIFALQNGTGGFIR
jgi:hypothetical protein